MSFRIALSGVAAAGPRADTHAGLWLDRYRPDLRKPAGGFFAAALATFAVPPGYRDFQRQFTDALANLPLPTITAPATVRGRMVVGLGQESVHETAIALHRTYGVPYLPGSALKGLAATFAHQEVPDISWQRGGDAFQVVFGEIEEAGFVTFHDALWIPPPESTRSPLPMALDVMTVHHPDYYSGKDAPPADWDDPNPVPFLTAQGTYLLALTGPAHWAEAAMDLLVHALDRRGLGAKTSAGYGRMDVAWAPRHVTVAAPAASSSAESTATAVRVPPVRPKPPAPPDPLNWSALLTGLGHGRDAQVVERIFATVGAAARSEAARRIIERLTPKELKKQKDKTWVKDLLAAAEDPREPDESS